MNVFMVDTTDGYLDLMNRRPMGVLGPVGDPICVVIRRGAGASPVPRSVASRRLPSRPWESALDRRRRDRLERHRLDAWHDFVVERLRRLR